MQCPDHEENSVGSCQTCSREICQICLEELDTPEDFECPECGEYGARLFDTKYTDLVDRQDEPENDRFEL